MQNLITTIKNSSIYEIDLDENYYNKFKENLFASLRKFGSSRKTKAVHKLVDENLIRLATFSGDEANALTATAANQNKLKAMFLNVFLFDDSLDQHGAVQIAGQIAQIQSKIQKEKTYLTDKQILNVEALNDQLDETTQKLLGTLDYIKIIDGIYFEYLKFLTNMILTQEQTAKPKVISVASDIIAALIKKIYLKVQRNIEPEMHQLIEAVSVYFILTFYFGETGPYAIAKMKGSFKPEVLDLIKGAKLTRFKSFSELTLLIKELNIVNITESAFNSQLQKIYGRYAFDNYIQKSLQEFLAVNANLAYNTQLFNAFPIDDELHARLEELVLNGRKKIVITPTSR